jgi:F0F1-type ATP synthase alpha subunit
MPTEVQIVVLFAGVRGYLNNIPTSNIRAYEKALIKHFNTNHSDVLAQIKKDKALSNELNAKIADIISTFTKGFVA